MAQNLQTELLRLSFLDDIKEFKVKLIEEEKKLKGMNKAGIDINCVAVPIWQAQEQKNQLEHIYQQIKLSSEKG